MPAGPAAAMPIRGKLEELDMVEAQELHTHQSNECKRSEHFWHELTVSAELSEVERRVCRRASWCRCA